MVMSLLGVPGMQLRPSTPLTGIVNLEVLKWGNLS